MGYDEQQKKSGLFFLIVAFIVSLGSLSWLIVHLSKFILEFIF